MLPWICMSNRISLRPKVFALVALVVSCTSLRLMGQVTAPPAWNFGAVSAGSNSTHTVTFQFTGAATIGSVSVVAPGAQEKDIPHTANDPSLTLCAGNSF